MRKGSLIVAGGELGSQAPKIFSAFVKAAGGARGRFSILPAAASDPEESIRWASAFLTGAGVDPDRIGVLEVSPLISSWRDGARDGAQIDMVRASDGIWFSGGDQNRITASLIRADGSHEPLVAAIRERLDAGAALAGSSAGAAIMSDPMIGGGTSFGALAFPVASTPHEGEIGEGEMSQRLSLSRGLGFFPEGIVDQHFDTRARLARLLQACLSGDGTIRLGYGVSEATAMVYSLEERRIELVGSGSLYIVDPRGARRSLVDTDQGPRVKIEGAVLHGLNEGDTYWPDGARFDFETKTLVPAREEFRARHPIASGALSGAPRIDAMFGMIEGDGIWQSHAWEIRPARIPAESGAGALMDGVTGTCAESQLCVGEALSFVNVRIDIIPVDIRDGRRY